MSIEPSTYELKAEPPENPVHQLLVTPTEAFFEYQHGHQQPNRRI